MIEVLAALALFLAMLAGVRAAIFVVSHARAEAHSIDEHASAARQPICNGAGPWNTWLLG